MRIGQKIILEIVIGRLACYYHVMMDLTLTVPKKLNAIFLRVLTLKIKDKIKFKVTW